MLSKMKLLSLILVSVFMVACSSTDTKDDMSQSDSTDSTSESDAQASAESSGVAQTTGVSESEIAEQAKMLTVYYFAFDQSALDAQTREDLDVVAAALKNTSESIRLEGHADERGTREYNLALSERRANAVKKYLSLQGIDAARIEVIGYGEEKPVGNDDANRRVELVK